jgi:hypothetical protein
MMKFTNHIGKLMLASAAIAPGVLFSDGAHAATFIDFESGFTSGQTVSTVSVPGNTVTFSLGANSTSLVPTTSSPFVAAVGSPVQGFDPKDGEGTDIVDEIGRFFLTDGGGAGKSFSYLISFANPLRSFSVDLLDFDALSNGDAVITAYSDSNYTTSIAVQSFSRDSPPYTSQTTRDMVNFSGIGNISSVSITYGSNDTGTGIDNISFETVPTPALLPGLIGMGVAALRRKQNETAEETA